jgi:hypothetical protein
MNNQSFCFLQRLANIDMIRSFLGCSKREILIVTGIMHARIARNESSPLINVNRLHDFHQVPVLYVSPFKIHIFLHFLPLNSYKIALLYFNLYLVRNIFNEKNLLLFNFLFIIILKWRANFLLSSIQPFVF